MFIADLFEHPRVLCPPGGWTVASSHHLKVARFAPCPCAKPSLVQGIMVMGRSTRLIASILLLLLIGWTVRWWRGRVETEPVRAQRLPGLDAEPVPAIDQPRE